MKQVIENPQTESAMTRIADKPTLIVFSDDWGRHPSSCQHLVKRLKTQFPIVWVNTIGTRTPKLDFFTLRRGLEKLWGWRKRKPNQVEADFSVIDLPMLPWTGSGLTRTDQRETCEEIASKALKTT